PRFRRRNPEGPLYLTVLGTLNCNADGSFGEGFMRKWIPMGTLLAAMMVILTPAASRAQVAVGVSIRLGPPAIPVYEQPPCPVEGYLWTPGYWAYGDAGYYWVPGVWV